MFMKKELKKTFCVLCVKMTKQCGVKLVEKGPIVMVYKGL